MSRAVHNELQIAQGRTDDLLPPIPMNARNGIRRRDAETGEGNHEQTGGPSTVVRPLQGSRAERHKSHRAPYLRAALMGANDGLVSTAALLLGISASGLPSNLILLTGVSALISGSLSMFVGEYVSVSAQRDSEKADINLEREQHDEGPRDELEELAAIYEGRGLNPTLARQVAEELSAHDPVRVHVREELGIDMDNLSRPWVAAFSSGGSFCVGSAIPLVAATVVQDRMVRMVIIAAITLVTFTIFGVISASLGGAPKLRASLRILFFGSMALGITFLIGHFWNQLFGIDPRITNG